MKLRTGKQYKMRSSPPRHDHVIQTLPPPEALPGEQPVQGETQVAEPASPSGASLHPSQKTQEQADSSTSDASSQPLLDLYFQDTILQTGANLLPLWLKQRETHARHIFIQLQPRPGTDTSNLDGTYPSTETHTTITSTGRPCS
jgi:hypothetical protein